LILQLEQPLASKQKKEEESFGDLEKLAKEVSAETLNTFDLIHV